MVKSRETKLLNYIMGVCKYNYINFKLKSGVLEYHEPINGIEVNPDFITFFEAPSEFYILYEIKMRQNPKSDSVIVTEAQNAILTQYKKYQLMKSNLDQLNPQYLPAMLNKPFFINYFYYNTTTHIVDIIISNISPDSDTYFLIHTFQSKSLVLHKGNTNTLNYTFIQELIAHIKEQKYWEYNFYPFTMFDLKSGIKGKGGSGVDVDREKALIIVPEILGFILQRKIREDPSLFEVTEIIRFLFNGSDKKIGEQESQALVKKIRLILEYMADDLFPSLKIEVIKKESTKFRITLRNTKNLKANFEEIQNKTLDHLKTKKITEFMK